MTNELAVREQITPTLWQMIESIAPALHESRLFGVANPAQAAAIMLKGYELGLPLSAAFEYIHVIQGKPTLNPRGALALIQGSDLLQTLTIEDGPDYCQVTMVRTNGFGYTVRFTMEDAQRAGLVKPESGWTKYPTNMLRWRAIGFCADVVFPDVIGGLKRSDELGAEIDEEGDVIQVEWEVRNAPMLTLNDLLETYTAEQIVVANEGKIPATEEEIAHVANKLREEKNE